MIKLPAKLPDITRSAEAAAAFLVSNFRKSVRGYIFSLPLFAVLVVTQNTPAHDPASNILDLLPAFWLTLIGSHCLLFLLLEKHVSGPKKPTTVPVAFPDEPMPRYVVDQLQMAKILTAVLNKNTLEELPMAPVETSPYHGQEGAGLSQTFRLLKFATFVTTIDQVADGLPVCIEADARLILELKPFVPDWDAAEAVKLYRRAEAQPSMLRICLVDSPAINWSLPLLTTTPATQPKKGRGLKG